MQVGCRVGRVNGYYDCSVGGCDEVRGSWVTPKDYLSQLFWLEEEINTKSAELLVLNKDGLRAARFDVERVTGGLPKDSADTLILSMERASKIHDDIQRLTNLKIIISGQVDNVEEPTLRMLLRKKYILRLSWEQIAVDMSYTVRYIYKLHGQALEEFKVANPKVFSVFQSIKR